MNYPFRINTFQQFMHYWAGNELERLFDGIIPSQLRHQTFSFYYKETKLFEVNRFLERGNFQIQENLDEQVRLKVLASIDRAGARIPYRCEFYPSTNSQQSPTYGELGVKYQDIDQEFPENASFHTFEEWFLRWLRGRIVVPDTCIIIDHYLSEVILRRINERLRIYIPRFVLLELERKGNRKDKYEKRLALSAFNEIRKLKLGFGAITFPSPVKAELLASFSKIASERSVDSFIRLEMWDYRHRDGITRGEERMVLLTKDMIMANTASAEDIDAFYFCPAQPENIEFSLDYLSPIITETAVAFNEIRLEGLCEEHSLIIEGMWSGKDNMAWSANRLKFSLRPH